MNIACLDMEGVLIPELWPHIAKVSGIDELAVTTREDPDYARLVERRIALLRHHGLRLSDVQRIVGDLRPLPGAVAFMAALRLSMNFRIVLVSDAFREMVLPLWRELGEPELRCHRLDCDAAGFISAAHYARQRGKVEVIEELALQGHYTVAVGDAFNDLPMLHSADQGFLFRPSELTLKQAHGLTVVSRYQDILTALHEPIVKFRQAIGSSSVVAARRQRSLATAG